MEVPTKVQQAIRNGDIAMVREFARSGGIKSGEARRKKAVLKQDAIALDREMEDFAEECRASRLDPFSDDQAFLDANYHLVPPPSAVE